MGHPARETGLKTTPEAPKTSSFDELGVFDPAVLATIESSTNWGPRFVETPKSSKVGHIDMSYSQYSGPEGRI